MRRERAVVKRSGNQRASRGFTLAELMVAITAGLIVGASAFALAKQGTKFFQQELRIANAQFEAAVGFDRLRNDIARAGYLGEPNVQRNPKRCPAAPPATWPAGLRSLAAVRLAAATPAESQDATNGLAPDRITLAGSYASADLFRGSIVPAGASYVVTLNPTWPGLLRACQGNLSNLASIFQPNRLLRVADDKGHVAYGVIQSFQLQGTQPQITLDATKAPLSFSPDGTCPGGGISGYGVGSLQFSVVNFIQYDVRNVDRAGPYAALYASTAPGEDTRHELVRVEVDALGNELADTLEVVSEYAVDLRFALTVVTGYGASGVDPVLQSFPFGDDNNYFYARDVTDSPGNPGPERIRSVRARLTVRSREGDRSVGLGRQSTIFRYQIPGTTTFARARTLVGDIQLMNLVKVQW